jgi:MinD-like ATPase involved in chromosome partitioning or flagellar assembly
MGNLGIEISNTELAEYFNYTEGNIRHMKKKNPKEYKALLESYIEYKSNSNLSDNPTVIMFMSLKGGVGKSALSRIFNDNFSSSDSVIVNFDFTRDVKKYTSSDVINYAELQAEDADLTPTLFIEELKEAGIKFIILDTPGELSNAEVLDALKNVDVFVLPFGSDQEEIDETLKTLELVFLSEIVDDNDEPIYPYDKVLNLFFVLNNYRDDEELDENIPTIANSVAELMAESIEVENFNCSVNMIKDTGTKEEKKLLESKIFKSMQKIIDEEDVDPNAEYRKINVSFSHLKHTKAIKTMNKTKKSLKKLGAENLVAYRVAKKRVKILLKDFKNFIKGQ